MRFLTSSAMHRIIIIRNPMFRIAKRCPMKGIFSVELSISVNRKKRNMVKV